MYTKNKPNYKLIYQDFIKEKHPDKSTICAPFFDKNLWTDLDIIKLNKVLLGNTSRNQRFKSYDKKTILEILNYQKVNNLNNCQLADHFKLSRNTVAKWKRLCQKNLIR